MTGKELAYLLEKTGIRNTDFADAMAVKKVNIAQFKRSRYLHPKTAQRTFEAFKKLGYAGNQIVQLLNQRFENNKDHPPINMIDEEANILIRLTDLQYENNQLKRHIEALEMNVQLLTEKYESALNYALNT